MSEEKYPDKYLRINLNWVDNVPFHKKGDVVVIFKDNAYHEITLETMSQEPMQLKWLHQHFRCRSCIGRKPQDVNKFVYRWNDGTFTEGMRTVNVIERLNALNKTIDEQVEKINELFEYEQRYNQIKDAINGEIWNKDDC